MYLGNVLKENILDVSFLSGAYYHFPRRPSIIQCSKFTIPENYKADTEVDRINQDTVINSQGKSLLELYIFARLRILNGRFIGDSLCGCKLQR